MRGVVFNLAVLFVWCNFRRVHQTLRMASGRTTSGLCGSYSPLASARAGDHHRREPLILPRRGNDGGDDRSSGLPSWGRYCGGSGVLGDACATLG